MGFVMVLRVALKALARNKMRTALTMLGMIIGVGAVITMVALGTGAQIAFDGTTRSGDPRNWRADISRLRALGFAPELGQVEESLAKLAPEREPEPV